MRRLSFASLFVLAIAEAAEPVPSVAPVPTFDRVAIASPSNSDIGDSTVKRSMSPETAAKLAAAAPKFVPPAPAPVSTIGAAFEVSPVLREADKPRNGIIRLPHFMVEEPKLHLPKDMQVLTPKGRVEYAFERRPGLRIGPFAKLNTWIALEMLEDDLLAQRRKDEAELWSLYLIRDNRTTSSMFHPE